MSQTPSQSQPVHTLTANNDWQAEASTDDIAVETAVALSYNGISHAVMLTSPAQLDDFALGFSLTEGIIDDPSELYDIELKEQPQGLELALSIHGEAMHKLKQQRRNLTGNSGCGLCGKDSLTQAMPELPMVDASATPTTQSVLNALAAFEQQQSLRQATGSVHAAAWCNSDGDIELLREDVGRHNALDKLLGALAANGVSTHSGFVLMSSRAGFELIAKLAQRNIGQLVTVSGATSLAIAKAQQANIGLLGFARPQRMVRYC